MSDFDQYKHEGARRDGYTPSHQNKKPGFSSRPRFSREGQSGDRPAYQGRNNGQQNRGGSRHGGYNNGTNNGYNNGGNSRGDNYRQGGYQRSEGSYQRQGGYARQGGYQQRPGGFQPRQDGEQQSRQGGGYQRQGGYQQRQGGGYQQRQGGFNRPRFNNEASSDGYGRPQGEGGFNRQQRGGYGRPQQGGGRGGNRNFNAGKRRVDYKEEAYDPNQPIRLNKFLANAGVCSRRDADKYIAAGVVTVNGEVITELGHKVLRSDVVLFHDQQIKAEKKIYVLLNKPKGYVTTSEDPQNRKTVMDLVRNACMERIYPVGRLDRNTTGVLLLTNDGEMASRLTHPKFLKKKIYHVYLDRNVTAADLRQIAEGITLEDGDIKADAIDYADANDKKQVGIEIHSGKNRIVRRIFASLGYNVIKLDRVYFAGLTKKNVKRGDWRFLTEEEVRMLRMGAYE